MRALLAGSILQRGRRRLDLQVRRRSVAPVGCHGHQPVGAGLHGRRDRQIEAEFALRVRFDGRELVFPQRALEHQPERSARAELFTADLQRPARNRSRVGEPEDAFFVRRGSTG